MNTYPTTPEQLFLDQQNRDNNNPGVIEYRKYTRRSSLQEDPSNKWKEDLIAGYASKRYDFPEYQWWMIQDVNKYLRSSKNFNVYDYGQTSLVVGIWNEVTQRIEFVEDIDKHNQELKQLLAQHKIRVE
jgi:hypothetical protein